MNNALTGGFATERSTSPRTFMLIWRVFHSAAPAARGGSNFHAAELLSVYPPPRTPNFPATAGGARTEATADPPLRFRSRPQPQRKAAGLDSAYRFANRSR